MNHVCNSHCQEDHNAVDVDQDEINILERALRECPFCVGRAHFFTVSIHKPELWTVMCDECEAQVSSDSAQNVTAKWNTRITIPGPSHGGFREGYRVPNPGI